MIKSELIQRLKELIPQLTADECERTLDTIFEQITAAMTRGDRVELRGFGVFSVKKRTARTARNPKTGVSVTVEARTHAYFKTGSELHKRLNGIEGKKSGEDA